MKYLVRMRNPKHKLFLLEAYEIPAKNEQELLESLRYFTDCEGYEIISWEEIDV